jgi:hypothetical protein
MPAIVFCLKAYMFANDVNTYLDLWIKLMRELRKKEYDR